jgi:hypothetical protein
MLPRLSEQAFLVRPRLGELEPLREGGIVKGSRAVHAIVFRLDLRESDLVTVDLDHSLALLFRATEKQKQS